MAVFKHDICLNHLCMKKNNRQFSALTGLKICCFFHTELFGTFPLHTYVIGYIHKVLIKADSTE